MNFKEKDCIIHVPQRLAGMDECMDNSCKRRAEYLCCSLVIVCREHGIFYTGEVDVPCIFYCNFRIPRNPGKTEHAQTVCTRLFSPRPRTSLGTRLTSRMCVSSSLTTLDGLSTPPWVVACRNFTRIGTYCWSMAKSAWFAESSKFLADKTCCIISNTA